MSPGTELPVVAVDFGTTLSSAAVVLADDADVSNARVAMVKDPSTGLYSFPSEVFDDGNRLIAGSRARRLRHTHSGRHRALIKREIGKDTSIALVEGEVGKDTSIAPGDRHWSVEELVASVLRLLREEAEKLAGGPLARAVLTVPAQFGPTQLRQLRSAARLAGFDPDELALMEEPVAAAFAPAAGAALPASGLLLVYDFGGGTFDAALVRTAVQQDSDWEVIGHAGLTDVGGGDITRLVAGEVIDSAGPELQTRLRLPEDPTSDREAHEHAQELRGDLEAFARDVKHALTDDDEYAARFEGMKFRLDRARFDELAAPLVAETIACCRDLLAHHDVTPGEVDACLLVGGSTRMPLVAEMLARELGRPLRHAEDPELAVALGAAEHIRRQQAPSVSRHRWVYRTALAGKPDKLLGAEFSPDGWMLAAGGVRRPDDEGWLHVWDVGSLTQRLALGGPVRPVGFHPRRVLITLGANVYLFDLSTNSHLLTITDHQPEPSCAALHPDGSLLAIGGPRAVELWDVDDNCHVAWLTVPSRDVISVTFSPNGRLLVSCDFDRPTLWDVPGRRRLGTFDGHSNIAWSAAFHPHGHLLATAGGDVRLWEIPSRRHVTTLSGHGDDVFAVAFHPDGHVLASAGSEGDVRLWEIPSGRHVATLTGPTGAVDSVAFRPSGHMLVAAGADGRVHVWVADSEL